MRKLQRLSVALPDFVDLLADENQHPLVVSRLRTQGHCVEWILETSPGAQDVDILRRPNIAAKVLLTYDRDFGDLIFNQGYPAPLVILYTRMNRARPAEIADRLIAVLEAGVAPGHIHAILPDGLRSRPFSIGATNG